MREKTGTWGADKDWREQTNNHRVRGQHRREYSLNQRVDERHWEQGGGNEAGVS